MRGSRGLALPGESRGPRVHVAGMDCASHKMPGYNTRNNNADDDEAWRLVWSAAGDELHPTWPAWLSTQRFYPGVKQRRVLKHSSSQHRLLLSDQPASMQILSARLGLLAAPIQAKTGITSSTIASIVSMGRCLGFEIANSCTHRRPLWHEHAGARSTVPILRRAHAMH